MHGTHTRSQNHSFSGLLTGIRGAEEKKPGVERTSMPLRETWESDGNQGWKDGVPGRKKEIREIKKPFREPAWGQPEEPGGGTKDSGIKNGGSRSDARREARKESMKKGTSREPKARPGGPIRLKRRRATLPHPLECSTIAAPGLSYRVRNGTGRLTRAMTTAKPRSRNDSQNTWRPFRPLCYEPWRSGNRLADARQTPIV